MIWSKFIALFEYDFCHVHSIVFAWNGIGQCKTTLSADSKMFVSFLCVLCRWFQRPNVVESIFFVAFHPDVYAIAEFELGWIQLEMMMNDEWHESNIWLHTMHNVTFTGHFIQFARQIGIIRLEPSLEMHHNNRFRLHLYRVRTNDRWSLFLCGFFYFGSRS